MPMPKAQKCQALLWAWAQMPGIIIGTGTKVPGIIIGTMGIIIGTMGTIIGTVGTVLAL